MTIIVEVFPQCDRCLETFPDVKHKSQKAMRMDMRNSKWPWGRRGKKDICPDCVAELSRIGKESNVQVQRPEGETKP